MANSPIQITIYDENDEVKLECKRLIIPWGMLKKALKLAKLEENQNQEEMFDDVANLIVEIFGNKFTLEDLEKGADIGEVFAVFKSIVSKASGYADPNLTAGK